MADDDAPFVFLDLDRTRPFRVSRWGGQWWIFYWHVSKRWVSLRRLTAEEVAICRRCAMPPDHAMLYDDLHARSVGTQPV